MGLKSYAHKQQKHAIKSKKNKFQKPTTFWYTDYVLGGALSFFAIVADNVKSVFR